MPQKERFNYSHFETQVRNLEIIKDHLQEFVPYFTQCQHVVDIGCGSGVFLSLLQDAGIRATGVEQNPDLAKQLRIQGFDVICGNAESAWSEIEFAFDGIFCSHLIEHLEFEQVVDLIEGYASKIAMPGTAVFAFPNPESLEMQLFQFWIDPQHVRFYHPKLIQAILQHYDFEITNTFDQGQWGIPTKGENHSQQHSPQGCYHFIKRISILRRASRSLKNVFGIQNLEIEADYVRKLRSIGREVVIVVRKVEK